jgi:hypothetical protein
MIHLYMQQVERTSFSESNAGGKELLFTSSNLLNDREEPTNVFNFTSQLWWIWIFQQLFEDRSAHRFGHRDFSGRNYLLLFSAKMTLRKAKTMSAYEFLLTRFYRVTTHRYRHLQFTRGI